MVHTVSCFAEPRAVTVAGEPQVHGFEEELDLQVFLFIGPIVMSPWGVGGGGQTQCHDWTLEHLIPPRPLPLCENNVLFEVQVCAQMHSCLHKSA